MVKTYPLALPRSQGRRTEGGWHGAAWCLQCSSSQMQQDDEGTAHFSRQLSPCWWHWVATAANRFCAEVLGRSLRCPLQGAGLRYSGYGSGRILSGPWLNRKNLKGYHIGMAQMVSSSCKSVPGAILPEVTLRSVSSGRPPKTKSHLKGAWDQETHQNGLQGQGTRGGTLRPAHQQHSTVLQTLMALLRETGTSQFQILTLPF